MMTSLEKLLVVEKLVELYHEKVTTISSSLPRSFPLSRAAMQALLRRMPPNLSTESTSNQVLRAAYQLVGLSGMRVPFTIHERVNALVESINGLPYAAIHSKYGVPKATLYRMIEKTKLVLNDQRRRDLGPEAVIIEDVKELKALLATKDPSLVQDLAWEIASGITLGRQAFFDDTEVAIQAEYFNAMTQGGVHCPARQVENHCRQLLKRKAEEIEKDTNAPGKTKEFAKRMKAAKLGRRWVRANFQKRTNQMKLIEGNKKTFIKTKRMDAKRAAASNPVFTATMLRKIEAMYKSHFENGVLRSSSPEPDQIYNGDEIGLDPYLRHGPSFSLEGSTAHSTTIGPEKAPYWSSMFFFSRADGKLSIPPMIVHQSDSTETISEHLVQGLHKDWLVSTSPSGYFVQSCFQHLAVHFKMHCGATAERPVYLFLDGHDSHWDLQALKFLLRNNIHVFFLKANGSAHDQPNDMGPNSSFKACFRKKVEDWSLRFIGMPMRPTNMNEVVVPAWDEFISNEKTSAIVQNAFKVSNLFPLNDPLKGIKLGEQQDEAGSDDETFVAAHDRPSNSDVDHDSSDGDQSSDEDDADYGFIDDDNAKEDDEDEDEKEDVVGFNRGQQRPVASTSEATHRQLSGQSCSSEGHGRMRAPMFNQKDNGQHETQFHAIFDATESVRAANELVATQQRHKDDIELEHLGFASFNNNTTDIRIRRILKERDPEEWRLSVKYMGHTMYHEKVVAPANEVQEMMHSQQAMKGNSAPKCAALGTTITATGIQVTEKLLEQIEAKKLQKKAVEETKQQRRQEKQTKIQQQAPANRTAAAEIVEMVRRGEDWKKQTVAQLRAAYEHFSGRKNPPKLNTNGSAATKADYLSALAPILQQQLQPTNRI